MSVEVEQNDSGTGHASPLIISSPLRSTRNQGKTTDEYFLKSGENISFFLEESAVDKEGNLLRPPALSLNKFGHAMHDLDPVFRSFSRSAKIRSLLLSLGTWRRPRRAAPRATPGTRG